MKELGIFICGMVFVSFGYPILDSISTWVQNFFAKKSVALQVQAEKNKQEVQEEESSNVHAIGFQVPEQQEEYDDEEWEEDE